MYLFIKSLGSNYDIVVLHFSEKNLVKDSSTEMRQRALELLNTATEVELKLVKGMTTKKFEVIESIRPFSTWNDAVSIYYKTFFNMLSNNY